MQINIGQRDSTTATRLVYIKRSYRIYSEKQNPFPRDNFVDVVAESHVTCTASFEYKIDFNEAKMASSKVLQ